ncbi:MAG: T9SS type A sorting domain-containing protein [Bacteroidia bacterium]|nr:T9SS type A sorting domain-containing protein [Bacteroidia bacterium]
MKNIFTHAVQGAVWLAALLVAGTVQAQCPNDNFLLGNLTPSGVGATASTSCIWAGDYVTVNVCAGATYTFSTCGSGWDTEITLLDDVTGNPLDYNDDFCGTSSYLTWVSSLTGTIRVAIDLYPCTHLPVCLTLDITQNTACGGGVPNDNPCGATFLPTNVGCVYTAGTNLGASGSSVPSPGCANYLGGDVWFKVVVPNSGQVIVNTDVGVVTDGGMALYSAPSCSGPFTLLDCDDDDSPNGFMPMISLSSLNPGDTIYIRFWEYGNNNNGSFNICVSDPSGGGGNPCGATVPDLCATACNLGTLPSPNTCDGSPSEGQGFNVTFNLTNVGATPANPYTYITNCQSGGDMAAPAADAWYTFVASGPNLDVDITGNISNPNIGLWEATGSCGNLTPRGCAVGSSGSLSETFNLLTVGSTYYLQISGGNAGDQGTFNMVLNNWRDCASCITGATLLSNPNPINGTYPPGTPVTFSFSVSSWNTTLANWLHGVIPTFGPGWDIGTLSTSTPASCDGSGTWLWRNSNTSTATSLVTGPGFYYDSNLGGPFDGNPGNNYGDNCTGGWTFSWTITTQASGCVNGTDLSISVNTTGDGETGSWSSFSCNNDPNFVLSASQTCLLPVDYSTFTAEREEAGNMLKWVTAAEINSDYFDIERSVDGIHFHKVGQKKAAGNSNTAKDYTFLDEYFEPGIVHYRLRQVDNNGLFEYSEVVTIKISSLDMNITRVYPNPVVNELFADLMVPQNGKFHVQIMDIMGKLHHQDMVNLAEGRQQLSVNVSHLSSGVYFLRLKNHSADMEVKQKFIK